MKPKLLKFVLFSMGVIVGLPVSACPDCYYSQCIASACACLPKGGCMIPRPLENGLMPLLVNPRLVITTFPNALLDVRSTILKAFNDTPAIKQLTNDAKKNLDKAVSDTNNEAKRFGYELESAGRGIGKYIEAQKNITTELDRAIQRTREGKFVDAIWHAGLAPLVVNEHSASEAVLESSYIRQFGQVAASTFGPEGAAAYAAWITYKETGDASLALRVGLFTGATSFANGQVANIPDVTKRAVVAATIGGVVVAASGGNEAAIKEVIFQAGAMIVVQDQYKRYTTHNFDPTSSSDMPAYCITASTKECTPLPKEAILEQDKNGNIVKVDMRKVDPKVPAVGTKDNSTYFNEHNRLLNGISKIRGMQAMAVFHDTWAVDWDMSALTTKASIIPAIVITYVGMGAPYYDSIQKTAVEKALAGDPNPGSTKITDALERGAGDDAYIRFDQKGGIDLKVNYMIREETRALWCGGPTGKNYVEMKGPSIYSGGVYCIQYHLGENKFIRPRYAVDSASLVTVEENGKETVICYALFDRNGCKGIAEKYVNDNAPNTTSWFVARAMSGK